MFINRMLSNKIKTRRKELGLSQRDLSVKASISQAFISQIENGDLEVSTEKMYQLQNALQVSVDWFGNQKLKKEIEEFKPAWSDSSVFVSILEKHFGISPINARFIAEGHIRPGYIILEDGSIRERNGLIRRSDFYGTIEFPEGYFLRGVKKPDGRDYGIVLQSHNGTSFWMQHDGKLNNMGRAELPEGNTMLNGLELVPVKRSWIDMEGNTHSLPENGAVPAGTRLKGGKLIFPGEPEQPALTDTEEYLIQKFRQLKPEDRATSLRIIEGFVASPSNKDNS